MKRLLRKLSFEIVTIIALIIYFVITVLNWFGIVSFEQVYGIMGTIIIAVLLITITRLVEKMDDFRDTISGIPSKPDDMFTNYSKHTGQSNEIILIQNAREEVRLLQETGSSIIQFSRNSLTRLLKSGGKIYIIICLPDTQCGTYIVMRNRDLKTKKALLDRYKILFNELNETLNPYAKEGQISLRFCPYPIAITLTIVDSQSDNAAKMIVRFADFKVKLEDKIGLSISALTNPYSFGFYNKQFENYARYSFKRIVIEVPSMIEANNVLDTLRDVPQNSVYIIDLCETKPEVAIDQFKELTNIQYGIIILYCVNEDIILNQECHEQIKLMFLNNNVTLFVVIIKRELSINAISIMNKTIKSTYAEIEELSSLNQERIRTMLKSEIDASIELIKLLKSEVEENA